jgi:hypothetical protein
MKLQPILTPLTSAMKIYLWFAAVIGTLTLWAKGIAAFSAFVTVFIK